ncbi:MAG: hypothetical protein HKM28_04180 [Flavobacteriaceae bacterium]|nr:hypothetical protein [Flavobacteriaceae bacterium]
MKKFFAFALCAFMIFTACKSDDEYSPTQDSQSPTAPLNLIATSIMETSISLSWEAATDNEGVTGYRLFTNGSGSEMLITTTQLTVTDLDPNTAYSFYVIAEDAAGNVSQASNVLSTTTSLTPIEFEAQLSDMGVFTGALSDLTPAAGVQIYELNSALFTDYATKQRLIKLPEGTSMSYDNSDLLPNFPDNTLIAKTFYYNIDDRDPSLGKQIIETRILLKRSGTWEAADYIWNEAQTEATYTTNGSETFISYIDENGTTQNVEYLIPSQQDCFTCHNKNSETLPIGMKLRSMNFIPSYISGNQLDHFVENGLLTGISSAASISVLPDWTDTTNYDLFERSRAYIDINCAHCHHPGGTVTNFDLDFRYETEQTATGIYANRGEIEARIQSTAPTYRMPQLGRTVVHDEAVAMLIDYLDTIED